MFFQLCFIVYCIRKKSFVLLLHMCFLQCNIVARCLNIFTDLLTLKDDRKTGGWCVFLVKDGFKGFWLLFDYSVERWRRVEENSSSNVDFC